MSEVLQSGLHPDADELCAFVEHALPAGERERTLAHLSVCPECRAVVALSLPPVDEAARPSREPARGRWFSGWNLVWSTAVALSATILFTVYVYRAATISGAPAQVASSRPAPRAAAPAGPSGSRESSSANLQPISPSGQNSQERATAATPRSAASAQRQQSMEANAFMGQNLAVSAPPSAMEREALNSDNMLKTNDKATEAKKTASTAAFGVAGMEVLSETQAQTSLPPGSLPSDRKIVLGAANAPMAKAAAPLRAALPPPAAPGTGNETVALAGA
ncbi:MAG: zf-HC2 domain-containing protein, partial [Terracidiphilus sp.]